MGDIKRDLSLVIRATEESQHSHFSNKLRPNSLTAEERQVVKEILLQRVQTGLQKVMQARTGEKPACKDCEVKTTKASTWYVVARTEQTGRTPVVEMPDREKTPGKGTSEDNKNRRRPYPCNRRFRRQPWPICPRRLYCLAQQLQKRSR